MSDKKAGDDKGQKNNNNNNNGNDNKKKTESEMLSGNAKDVKDKIKDIKTSLKHEDYWTFIRVLKDVTRYLEGDAYPMLRRQGVGDETIAMLSVMIMTKIQEAIISQLAVMKPSVESIRSLEAVQEAVSKIYKQYNEKQISASDALDMLFSIFDSVRNRGR